MRYWLIIFVGLVCAGAVLAQGGPSQAYRNEAVGARTFSHSEWEELRQNNDYTKDVPPARKTQPLDEERNDESWSFPTIGDSRLVTVLAFVGGAMVLALLFYLVFINRRIDRRVKDPTHPSTIDLDNIEENLERADVDAFIRQAVAAGDYPLAVRLHYLAVLKQLSESGSIQWKKDKTNYTYLKEMQGHPAQTAFRDLTHTFERVWYGRRTPTVEQFAHMERAFLDFRRTAMPTPQPQT